MVGVLTNYKWAPISSTHSFAINNEGGTLKIPMGFYKTQVFCTMVQEGHCINPLAPKLQKIPKNVFRGRPAGILDLLVKTPVLETTSVSRDS